MFREPTTFWVFAICGAALAGWWLAVRPGPQNRDLATPVAFLIVLLAVLLCLLAISDTSANQLAGSIYGLLRSA